MTIDKGIPIKNIFYMLAYAFKDLNLKHYQHVKAESFDNIHDLFAEIISLGISLVLKQGLHREYINHQETLNTLRGKLDIQETMKEKMKQTGKLNCEYDDFSCNNIFNQILKATMMLLIKHSHVSKKRKDILRKLLLFFSEVETIDLKTVKWNTMRYDRNSRTYQMLHSICYFIVSDLLLSTEKGKVNSPIFSDENMALLFQRFILEYYRQKHPEFKARGKQVEWNLDTNEEKPEFWPTMNTDITLELAERKLVIDAKYYGKTFQESYGKKTFHSPHIYQIYAYVTNEDKHHKGNVDGMLLYAMTEKDGEMSKKIKLETGNIIQVKTLDLSKDFAKITEQLEEIVSHN